MKAAIQIEGGSTPYGMGDTERGGWANRLHIATLAYNSCNVRNPIMVKNNALPGLTLPYALKTLDESTTWLRNLGPVTVVASAGINESKLHAGMERPALPLEFFATCAGKLCSKASELGISLVFVGPQPVDETKTTPSAGGSTMENDLIEKYDAVLKNTANSHGVPYVDTQALFRGGDSNDLLAADGYHPSPKGHELIHETVKTTLQHLGTLPSAL
jgi:lysophospholipase L1-like esterase